MAIDASAVLGLLVWVLFKTERFLNSGRVESIDSLISSLNFDKPIPFLHLPLPTPPGT